MYQYSKENKPTVSYMKVWPHNETVNGSIMNERYNKHLAWILQSAVVLAPII